MDWNSQRLCSIRRRIRQSLVGQVLRTDVYTLQSRGLNLVDLVVPNNTTPYKSRPAQRR
jgi:hypothetical protein